MTCPECGADESDRCAQCGTVIPREQPDEQPEEQVIFPNDEQLDCQN